MSGVVGSGLLRAGLAEEPGGCTDEVCLVDLLFDDFNRSEATEWGTSTYGIAWSSLGADSNNFISVNGSEGRLVSTGSASAHFRIEAKNGPWKNNKGWTMTSRIKIPNQRPNSGHWNVSFEQDFTARSVNLFINEAAWTSLDFFSLDGNDVPGPDVVLVNWNLGAYYLVKWEYQWDGVVSRAKIWEDGTTEPDWMVSLSWTGDGDPTNDTDNYFSFEWQSSGTSGTGVNVELLVDYLRFQIDRCAPVQFDDFTRSVASDWGTATPSGYVWTPVGVQTDSVVSGVGRISGTVVSPSTVQQHAQQIGNNATPIFGPFSQDFTMHARLRIITLGTFGTATSAVQITVNSGTVLLQIESNSSTIGNGRMTISKSGGASDTDVFPISNAVFYNVKWEHIFNVSSKAKIWAIGATEPATWLVERDATGDTSITPHNFSVNWVVVRSSGGNFTSVLDVDFIEFDYDEKPCYVGGPVPGDIPGGVVIPARLLGSGNPT